MATKICQRRELVHTDGGTEDDRDGQAIERAYRVRKTHSRKYKGGAM